MNTSKLKSTLHYLLGNLYGKSIKWRLDGSANLWVQGVQTTINDLDIATDEKGYKYFKSCFEKHPFKYGYNQKISSHTIVGQYKEVELEINCYDG